MENRWENELGFIMYAEDGKEYIGVVNIFNEGTSRGIEYWFNNAKIWNADLFMKKMYKVEGSNLSYIFIPI